MKFKSWVIIEVDVKLTVAQLETKAEILPIAGRSGILPWCLNESKLSFYSLSEFCPKWVITKMTELNQAKHSKGKFLIYTSGNQKKI